MTSGELKEYRRVPSENQFRDASWTGFAHIAIDSDGMIVHITERAEQMFGYYARNQLVGQPIEVLVPENMRESHVGHRNRFLSLPSVQANRLMNGGLAVMAVRQDGSLFAISVTLRVFYFEQRQYVIAIVSEIHGELPTKPNG